MLAARRIDKLRIINLDIVSLPSLRVLEVLNCRAVKRQNVS
jgi:hypothetical protein